MQKIAQIRCATSSSVERWDDHVEPGSSTGSLPWRDHAGLRFGCSGAHRSQKLCWTADATLSRTPQWSRLRAEERLSEWMFHWAKVRHDEAAERTLLTAVGCDLTREGLNRMVFGPIQERIYADGGHALDLSNKAFHLLEFIGWEYATEVLPLIVEHLTQSRSEEEQGAWRAPVDLIELHSSSRGGPAQEPAKNARRDRVQAGLLYSSAWRTPSGRCSSHPRSRESRCSAGRSRTTPDTRGGVALGAFPGVQRYRRLVRADAHFFRFAMRFIGCWHGLKQGRNWSADYSMRPCRSPEIAFSISLALNCRASSR